MKYLMFLLSCSLILGLSPVSAQEMVTAGQVFMLDDQSAAMNSDKKDRLSWSVSGMAFNGRVFLAPNTLVKVVSRQTYVKQDATGTRRGYDGAVSRTYNVALVEVLEGDNVGKKGWVVLDVQEKGQRKSTYLVDSKPGRKPVSASAAAGPRDFVDLVVMVGAGHISPTGGRLYEIGVLNRGDQVVRGNVEVLIEIEGKGPKVVQLKGPINPNQAVSYTLPMGDSELRKGVTIKATVDPKNQIKELDENNNTATAKAAP